MSEQTDNQIEKVDLDSLSQELRQVIEYEQVPEEIHTMLVSVHEVSESSVREVWDGLPKSAQNILDNFEQFHALVSLSQSYAGIDALNELQDLKLDNMSEDEVDAYKAQLLDKVLFNCVKDLAKQLKQARLKPAMKREFQEIFAK